MNEFASRGLFTLDASNNQPTPSADSNDRKAEIISVLVARLVKSQLGTSLDPSIPLDNNPEFVRLYSSCLKTLNSQDILPDSRPPLPTMASVLGTPKASPTIDVGETQLLRDLLYVFQGIDGQGIKWDARNNMYIISDVRVPPAIKSLVFQIQELGYNYRQIQSFINNTKSKGLIQQSLLAALHTLLTDYYRTIAQLESQLPREHDVIQTGPALPEPLSLKSLFVLIQEPLERLRFIKVLVEACERLGKAHGGALITLLYAYRDSGDPSVQQFAQVLLQEAQKPFVNMLRRWLFEGELDDPFDEFFIQSEEGRGIDMWTSKYTLRPEMIPSFISSSLAEQILYIGKCLNFIRHVCKDHDYVIGWSRRRETSMSSTSQSVDTQGLTNVVGKAHKEISRHLLYIIFGRHKFVDHLGGIKRYLLTGQGDFIQYLMETVGPTLNEDAAEVRRQQHHVTGMMDTAIRSTNAQYDDPDIIKCLDVEMLPWQPGENGWAIFSLKYTLEQPLSTILNEDVMSKYRKLFNFLWQIKGVEQRLGTMWRLRATSAETYRAIKECSRDWAEVQLLLGEMVQFTAQLQHYLSFEVLESSWEELNKYLKNGPKDLDDLISHHTEYLDKMMIKGLVHQEVNSTNNLYRNVQELFQTMLKFKKMYDNFSRWSERISISLIGKKKTKKEAPFMLSSEDLLQLEQIRTQVATIRKRFHQLIKQFLQALQTCSDESLRDLSIRLNYNNFYTKNE